MLSVSGFFLSEVSGTSGKRVSGTGEIPVLILYEGLFHEKYTPACAVINTDRNRIMVINRCFVCNFGANYAEKEVNMLIL